MNINEMNLEQLEKRIAEIRELVNESGSDLDALSKELDQIDARKKELKERAEKRAELAERVSHGAGTVVETGHAGTTSDEIRANTFAKTGMTKRSLVVSGKIAKPTTVGGINDIAGLGTGIVDDVMAQVATGAGTWRVAYKKKEATAADVTDGSAIGGTGSEYDYVDIAPATWGVTDEISNMVAKMTPLNYEAAVVTSAITALRVKASEKIVNAIIASDLAEKVNNVALDANYLRERILGFKSIVGKGARVLYINNADLIELGKVRGTSEKKPLYEINFEDDENTSGTISEGGAAVKFRIVDALPKGTQLYGQPLTVEMPMWGDYEIATDGSEKFSENMLVIRGLQTANAGLCAYHGMQIIKQAAE